MKSPANVANFNVGPTVSTYNDATVVDGSTYVYWVTAVEPNCPTQPFCGESAPSNVTITQTVPLTGSHSITLNWTLSTSSGVVSQNIYRAQSPNAPTGATAVVN